MREHVFQSCQQIVDIITRRQQISLSCDNEINFFHFSTICSKTSFSVKMWNTLETWYNFY